ncbi:MAG: hypothetical protein ACWGQW_01105 [bacterium]
MRELEVLSLYTVGNSTAAGVTGSYIDTQGYIGHGGREVKVVLIAGPGTTVGTCGGYVQSAVDTAGTGVATGITFTGLNTTGGYEEGHFVIPATHRYVRFVGTVQATKDMDLGCIMVAPNRYSP